MKLSVHAKHLLPHAYQHDLVVPAVYVVVEPKKGHSTIFRLRDGAVEGGLAEARRRGFKPLYVVRAKP